MAVRREDDPDRGVHREAGADEVVRDAGTGEIALATSDARLRGLFEGAGVGIAIMDLDGRYVDANAAYVRMLGYDLEALRDLDASELIHPDDQDATRRLAARLRAGTTSTETIEARHRAADGRTVWVRASIALIRDPDGTSSILAATTEDITETKLAAERLARSEHLRRLAGELALVGGWSVDVDDGNALSWSDDVHRILGAPPGAVPSFEEVMARYPEPDRARVREALERSVEDGRVFDLEVEIDTFDGRRIPLRLIGEPQRGADGRVVRVIGAVQDTSELAAESARAAQVARRLTVTFESMTDAIYLLDRAWRFTYLNERAARLLRRDRDELLGQVVWEAFPDARRSVLGTTYERAMVSGEVQSVEDFHYPPLDRWVDVTVYPSSEGLAVYFRDVTERHEAQLALRRRERQLERQATLLDEAQDAIIVCDVEGHITSWNRSAEEIHGWSAEEAIGRDIRELLALDAEVVARITAAVRSSGRFSGEVTQHDRAGGPRTIAGRWTLVHGEDGQPDAILAIHTDVTEQRRVEQQLLRAQRMESLGTLAGGVAHDLNNVLAPVLLAAELLAASELSATDRELLETIVASARRGADLVAQVLSFARGVEGQRAPLEIGAILADLEAIVRDTFPKHVELTIDRPGRIGTVLGDRTQVQQVLLNLAVNARDAMPRGGHLMIGAEAVVLDERDVADAPGTRPGEHVLLRVEDDGIGMSPEVLERALEPFFTTKPLGSGTGLGLPTSAAIVRSHGGSLRIHSEPGRGSRFEVLLPVAASAAPSQPAEEAPAEVSRGAGETVLVVDDEAAVLAMTRRTLEAAGYRVLTASNGAEAVSVYVEHRDEVAVVLTDMMMPIMDGPTMVRALQRIAPRVRVIGASGLPGDSRVVRATAAGVRHVLPKPYTSARLLEVVASVLEGDDPGAGTQDPGAGQPRP